MSDRLNWWCTANDLCAKKTYKNVGDLVAHFVAHHLCYTTTKKPKPSANACALDSETCFRCCHCNHFVVPMADRTCRLYSISISAEEAKNKHPPNRTKKKLEIKAFAILHGFFTTHSQNCYHFNTRQEISKMQKQLLFLQERMAELQSKQDEILRLLHDAFSNSTE